MMAFSVQVWLICGFGVLPVLFVYRMALAGRSFQQSIQLAIILTFAGVGPSVVVAILLGPWAAVLALFGYFWWQWRTVE